MNKLIVALPAYNEEENISVLMDRWLAQKELLKESFQLDLHIVVIDDGSKDETAVIVKEAEQNTAHIHLVQHETNKGLGAGVRTGIGYFLDNYPDGSYLCVMDADNTQDPIYIPHMLHAILARNADVVIASRYRKGSRVDGVSPLRLVMSSGARFVFSTMLRVPGVRDYTCGYRLYKRAKLQEAADCYGAALIEETGFTCMVELLYKLYSCGATFAEVPFHLRYDQKMGSSKMSVMKTAWNSTNLAFRLKRSK